MLSSKQLKDICLVNVQNSSRCRYISQDETDEKKYYCLKNTSKASSVDKNLDDLIYDLKRRNKDPHKENIAMGDNCQGYPFLRHILQGYDC